MNKYNESMVQRVFITRFLINTHDRTRKNNFGNHHSNGRTTNTSRNSIFDVLHRENDVKSLDFPRISTGYMPMDFAKFSKKVANRIYAEWDI